MAFAETTVDSPIGPLFLAASDRGLTELSFKAAPGGKSARPATSAAPEAAAHLEQAANELREYFAGDRQEFDVPVDIDGSPFRIAAWRAIAEIPFGHTTSYSEVASRAGNPRAYRAAGSACASNPVAIIIPCHRVLGTDARLHGFGGGLDVKARLLEHEGAVAARRLPVSVA